MRGFISRYVFFLGKLCGGVNGVRPFGVSVVRGFAQQNPDSGGREMCL